MAKRAMTAEAKALKARAILDKAAEMFLDSEYDKIKMPDIAKQMKISNGILFICIMQSYLRHLYPPGLPKKSM